MHFWKLHFWNLQFWNLQFWNESWTVLCDFAKKLINTALIRSCIFRFELIRRMSNRSDGINSIETSIFLDGWFDRQSSWLSIDLCRWITIVVARKRWFLFHNHNQCFDSFEGWCRCIPIITILLQLRNYILIVRFYY